MSNEAATLIAAGIVVVAGAVGGLWKKFGTSKEKALDARRDAAKRWKEIAARLTAGLDQIAQGPEEATLQVVKREFRKLQGASAAVADAFDRKSAVADTERKLRFLLSQGVEAAKTAVTDEDPDKAQAAQAKIREVTVLMVDDPIHDVFEPEVKAALKEPKKVITEPVSESYQRDRLDQYVSDHGGVASTF